MALFGQQETNKTVKKKNEKQQPEQVPEFIKILAELNRRLRLLEERVDNLYEKVKVINNTLTNFMDEQNKKIESNDVEIENIKDDIKNIKSAIQRIFDQSKSLATKRDIKILEKYVQILSPIKYLTKEEVINKEEGE